MVLIILPRQMIAWYYMKFLHLWRKNDHFETNIEHREYRKSFKVCLAILQHYACKG